MNSKQKEMEWENEEASKRPRKRKIVSDNESKTKKAKTDVNDEDSPQDEVKCFSSSSTKSESKRLKGERTRQKVAKTKERKQSTATVPPTSKNDPLKKTSKPSAISSVPVLKGVNNDKDSVCQWRDEEYIADSENIDISIARNVIKLLDEDNTIPFVARYRSHLTGGLKPDKIRKIKATYDYVKQVRSKAEQLVEKISAKETVSPSLLQCIYGARSLEELEFLSAPYKKDSKGSLAERARKLGLEVPAQQLLEGKGRVELERLVNPKVEGLKEVNKVKLGIQHIIADMLHKDVEVHSLLRKMKDSGQIILQSKLKGNGNEKGRETTKYDLYGNFSQPVRTVRPHQVLAINRGESENKLSVKLVIPDELWTPIKNYCRRKWMTKGYEYELRRVLFDESVADAIKRLCKELIPFEKVFKVSPFVTRRVRSKLNEEAADEAVNVFATNLRELLMTPPYRGKVVMGIDPGFQHGCKVAVVSQTGELLAHDKFFLSQKNTKIDSPQEKVIKLVSQFRCETIALGNGVGCRETEAFLSDLIQKNCFKPLNVSYTIISEQGVSIYSCSSAASEEFPNLEPTFIGAISLARRLQDPLSELVKVEPKHLGVGLYQHDVKEKKLISTLDEIVCECVSFVGVDINTASFYLLKRIAGLGLSKAQEIVKYRSTNCPFKTREDLKKVKGISVKTFQQCAGFIRVIPCTAKCKKPNCCKVTSNPLDQTSIHPESYETAFGILKRFGLNLDELGSKKFIKDMNNQRNVVSAEALAKDFDSSIPSVILILDSLTKPIDFDVRSVSAGPIFQQEIKKMEQLMPGDNLTGVVRNTVPFGAFVDVGVGVDGLIHRSQMGNKTLRLNDRVSVEVSSINLSQKRIQLKLLSVIQTNPT